jgi:hypothetical protein
MVFFPNLAAPAADFFNGRPHRSASATQWADVLSATPVAGTN